LHETLPKRFYERDVIDVAKNLLGQHLVRVIDGVERVGRIVEVEAYLGPHDAAAHSSKGKTARTAVMFGPAGHAYVYLIYGMYHCMNVVVGDGAAILIRAVEPIKNIDAKTSGPGLLCRAMAIDKKFYGHDLQQPPLYIAAGGKTHIHIVKRPRVGVDYAGHWARRLLRFYIRDNSYVSQK
jgi:DNA-3-methyladenine glycosylase